MAQAKVISSGDIRADYPSVFDGNVKTMEGELFHIALTDDAKPFCVHTPRTIPYALRDKLKSELELLQEQNIIAPVTEPTEWCAPIVVATKKGTDKIRMCVDLSHLNKYVRRERYQCPTPAQAVADIASENAKVFTKLDALKGYHQCPLDEESQLLTTFITPFGRFKYLRAPYGISSISEHYNRRAHPLPEIHIGTNVAIQNPLTKQWDIYGVVTHIGPYRQYHVKLINGRVLVRNRRFIRRRVPAIPFRPSEVHVPPAEPPSPPPLRRSSRLRKQPIRYADEFGDVKGEM